MTPLFRRLPLVLALAAPLATLAQGLQAYHPRPGADHPGPDSPLRSKMQAYVQANVLPTLRQQRQQLETQLAPADQLALAGYRTQLHDLRTQRQALHEGLRPAAGRPAPTDEQRQQMHELRAQEGEILDQVRELAHKYASNMQQLTQKIQPQRAQWASALQAMLPPRPAAEANARPDHQPGGFHHGGPLGELLRPTAFLLLEPAQTASEAVSLTGTALYPNPAVASTQLQYEVKQAGAVRVELLDAQGNPLRTLVAEASRQPGTYSQALDFSNLVQGTYFYKVTTAAGSQTKRFVKE